MAAIRDISVLKQIEAEVQSKNEALAKALSERDKFFSIIAHDLRSPFNGLLGLTRMLDEDLKSMDIDQVQHIASALKNATTNVYSLVENLLEWSNMQRGNTNFNPEEFLLSQKINDFLHPAFEQAHKKKIKITIIIPDYLLVFCDANMIGSTIRNLVTNAIKFTPQGGEVVISAMYEIGSSVKISIKDNGIGMTNTMIDKLFKLNENTSRKGTENEPSTGLGLILSKEFVEKHGGSIRIESEVGKGSTFYFTLPFQAEGKGIEDPNKIINSVFQNNLADKLKIVIAEDDEPSSQLLIIKIRHFAKEIFHTKSGKEAVDICLKHPDIDLVLMDILLPELNGYEATRAIRRFNKDVTIIAQTAYTTSGNREKAIDAGCNDYVEKPFAQDQLLAVINKYFTIS